MIDCAAIAPGIEYPQFSFVVDLVLSRAKRMVGSSPPNQIGRRLHRRAVRQNDQTGGVRLNRHGSATDKVWIDGHRTSYQHAVEKGLAVIPEAAVPTHK